MPATESWQFVIVAQMDIDSDLGQAPLPLYPASLFLSLKLDGLHQGLSSPEIPRLHPPPPHLPILGAPDDALITPLV